MAVRSNHILLAVMLFGAETGCGSPASIADASPAVKDVNVTGPNVNILIEQEARTFEGSAVMEAGMMIQPVVLALKAGVPGPGPDTIRVVFDVRFGKPERAGERAPDRFGTVNIPLAAIKRFDPGSGSVLELSETFDLGSGASADAAVASCKGQNSFVANAPHFCGLVLAAADK